jgi:phenylacetate-CoA ligase
VGRKQQLLKVRGTSLYPTAILEAARCIEEVQDCVVVADREDSLTELSDRVTVFVQLRDRGDEKIKRTAIEKRLQAVLRVTPEVRVVNESELGDLTHSAGRKARRFVDRRSIV